MSTIRRFAGWGARALTIGLGLLFAPQSLCRAQETSAAVPFPKEVRVVDLDGQRINPFGSDLGRGVVLIFLSVECPISNSYLPECRRLADEFTPKGFVFRLVFPNQDESAEQIRKHLQAYRCTIAALRDPDHDLVKESKARYTPEVAIFARGKGLVYHGRINDRYVELGRTRSSATRHDLREAIEALLHGKLPDVRSTQAVGCYIAGVP